MERIYGISHGGDRKSNPINSDLITQEQIGRGDDFMEQKMLDSLLKTIEGLIDTVEKQDQEIKELQQTIVSMGELVNNHNDGINLILQVLNDNGLIDVDI